MMYACGCGDVRYPHRDIDLLMTKPHKNLKNKLLWQRLPISALNLKNPGPITSLLQSYRASTTYKKKK